VPGIAIDTAQAQRNLVHALAIWGTNLIVFPCTVEVNVTEGNSFAMTTLFGPLRV
jgi:hypothetical protein